MFEASASISSMHGYYSQTSSTRYFTLGNGRKTVRYPQQRQIKVEVYFALLVYLWHHYEILAFDKPTPCSCDRHAHKNNGIVLSVNWSTKCYLSHSHPRTACIRCAVDSWSKTFLSKQEQFNHSVLHSPFVFHQNFSFWLSCLETHFIYCSPDALLAIATRACNYSLCPLRNNSQGFQVTGQPLCYGTLAALGSSIFIYSNIITDMQRICSHSYSDNIYFLSDISLFHCHTANSQTIYSDAINVF